MAEPRTVLITGCSTGIGRATAERFASHGWTTIATARRPDAIADLEPAGCRLVQLDVTDTASIDAALGAVGRVDVLVNNAGYGSEGTFEEVPMDEVRRQFETNIFGLIDLTKRVLPGMREAGWGRVINISSMGGKLTFPGGGYYHATKHAVEALSDALRFEVKGFGVRVVVVEPGPVRTEFGNTAMTKIGHAASDDGPYAAFNQALAAAVKSAYEGPMARAAVSPATVAKVIERAARRRRPRSRYRVTAAARVLLATRKVLPDRAFDAFLRTQFPRPGR